MQEAKHAKSDPFFLLKIWNLVMFVENLDIETVGRRKTVKIIVGKFDPYTGKCSSVQKKMHGWKKNDVQTFVGYFACREI